MILTGVAAQKLFSTLTMSLDLEKRGLVLVDGLSMDDGCSNGSGKSTVANKIIIWTLFGRTAGGLRGDKVIHRHFPKEKAWGSVNFMGNDGKKYTVYRQRNPSVLHLVKESIDISSRMERDTQELIDSALGRDFNTFLHTDFFGQGRKDSFLDLAPKQQGELLEEILPIDQIDQWAETAKELRDSTRASLQRAEASMAELRASYAEVERNSKKLSYSSEEWSRKQLLKITDTKQAIRSAPSIASLEGRFTSLTLELSAYTIAPIKEITEALASWQIKKEQWIRTLATLDLTPVDGTCSTCNQQLPVAQRAMLLKAHEENEHTHDVASNNVEGCTAWIEHWEEQRRWHDKKLELRALKDEIAASENVTLTRKLNDLRAELDPYVDLLVQAEIRYDDLAGEIEGQEGYLEEIKNMLEKVEYWTKAFAKDFKALLFQKACPYLESRTRSHLSGLGNPQLKVTFSTAKLLQSGTTRDEFNIAVSSDTGGESFDSLSGGEQQMVSFAVGLALADLAAAQVGGPSEFMILDEPFMSLSEKNCESIVRYLTDTISKYKSTILLISNEPNIKTLIPHTIQVEKKGGITSIARQS